MNDNYKCYQFEYRNYNDGILDNFVDATYIITMVNSSRKNHIEEELQKIIPTKNVYIVHNQGFKNCKKILKEQIHPYDLSDAYFNIMNHSVNNNYNNILVLEDDFIFNDKIKDKVILQEIESIFTENKNIAFYFNLGPIPFFFYPNVYSNIYKGIFTGTTHSIIYNKKLIQDLTLKNTTGDIVHWDNFLTYNYSNYFYKIPLCYQVFPQTENKKHWENYFPIIDSILSYLKLDTQPEPGFTIIYTTIYVIRYLVLFLFVYLIYILIKYLLV